MGKPLENEADTIVWSSGAGRGLAVWSKWMRGNDELRALGYPAKAPGLSTGGIVTDDAWLDLEEECDGRTAIVVETAINGLPPAMRAAIERYCELTSSVRMRDYHGQLADACGRIYRALVSKGCA